MLESASCASNSGNSSLSSSLVDASIQVLGSLLSENDEVIETWFLLGCAFQSSNDLEQAREHYEKAKGMMEKTKKAMEEEMEGRGGFDNEGLGEQIEDVDIQIDDISERIEGCGGGAEGEDMDFR